MKNFLIAYIGSVVTFLVIDGIWLAFVARGYYFSQLGPIMREQFLVAPAALFYLLYTAGMVLLAVRPFDTDIGLLQVAFYGALVGMCAYGTYDMTNLSVMRDYPIGVAFVDWAWGTALTALCAVVGRVAMRAFA